MSPRSDGIYCYNCDEWTDRFYWRCYDCDSIFCSTACIQEMLVEHKIDCDGQIKQVKKKTGKLEIPCKFFLLGKCKNGESCEFVHNDKQIPCEYFASGDCKYKDKCAFLHDPYAQKLRQAPRFQAGNAKREEKKKEVKEKPVCFHFQKGMCSYGDQCFKSHVKPVKPANNNNNNIKIKSKTVHSSNNNGTTKTYPQKPINQKPVSIPVRTNPIQTNGNNLTNGANKASTNYVPSNTIDYELAMENEDEIFLSDSSDEEELPPGPARNNMTAATPPAQNTCRISQSSNTSPQEKAKFNGAKENKKKSKQSKTKPKEPEIKNKFLYLQGSEDEGETETDGEDERPSSASTTGPYAALSSKSPTPVPKELTKKEKKMLAKQQKMEDIKVIVDNLRLEGNRIFEQGKIDKSIELYTKAIQKAGPNNPCYKLFNNRSAAYMKKKEYILAQRDAAKCLELDSDNIKALRRLVQCCTQLGLIEEAKLNLKKLVSLDKNSKVDKDLNPKKLEKSLKDAEKLLKEAEKHFDKGTYHVAEDYVDKTLKICGSSSVIQFMKATCAFLNDRRADAKKLVEDIEARAGKDPNLKCSWYYFAQGLVYIEKGDLTRALSQLSVAKKDHPRAEPWHDEVNQVNTYLTQAKREVKDGYYEDALDLLRAGLQVTKAGKCGKSIIILFILDRVEVFQHLLAYDLAMEEIDAACESYPSSIELKVAKANVLRHTFKYDEALQELEKVKRMVQETDLKEARKIEKLYNEIRKEKDLENSRAKWEEQEREKRRRKQEAENARRRRMEEQEEEAARRKEQRRQEIMKTRYYETLGVSEDADQRTIKQEFHKKALMFHPDKHAAASVTEKKAMEEKMKEITRAHTILSDPQKRAEYDRKLAALDDSDNYDSDYDCYSDDDDDFNVEMFFRWIFMNQYFSRR